MVDDERLNGPLAEFYKGLAKLDAKLDALDDRLGIDTKERPTLTLIEGGA
jgi:hypothetical protein